MNKLLLPGLKVPGPIRTEGPREYGPGGPINPSAARVTLPPRKTIRGGVPSNGIVWTDPAGGVVPDALWWTMIDWRADDNYELDSWQIEQGATDNAGIKGPLAPWGDSMGRGGAVVLAINPDLKRTAAAAGSRWYTGHARIPGLSESKGEEFVTDIIDDVFYSINFPPGELLSATANPGPVRVVPRTLGRGYIPIRKGDRLVAAFVIGGDYYAGISGDVFAHVSAMLHLGRADAVDAFDGAAPR